MHIKPHQVCVPCSTHRCLSPPAPPHPNIASYLGKVGGTGPPHTVCPTPLHTPQAQTCRMSAISPLPITSTSHLKHMHTGHTYTHITSISHLKHMHTGHTPQLYRKPITLTAHAEVKMQAIVALSAAHSISRWRSQVTQTQVV